MEKTYAAERIAEACLGIIRRSDQIVALAETPDAELSRIFSRKEIRVTNGICCELALAVAGFAKPGKEGLEKAWNSICQQAKVLDERLLDKSRIGS